MPDGREGVVVCDVGELEMQRRRGFEVEGVVLGIKKKGE